METPYLVLSSAFVLCRIQRYTGSNITMHVVGQVGRWPIVRTDLLIGKNMVTAVLKCQWKVEGEYG